MSYYDERDRITPQQVRVVRWVLEQRVAGSRAMQLPTNTPASAVLEAEAMEVNGVRDASVSVQSMVGFGAGDWSADAQLFVRGKRGSEVTFGLHTKTTHDQPFRLFATRAPDYGLIRLLLDDEPLGAPIDLYAPVVVPTGPILLDTIRLDPGEHRLTFRIVDKHPASRGFAFGIDAFDAP